MSTDLERAARRVLETATPAFDTGEARHAHAAALNALRAALPAEQRGVSCECCGSRQRKMHFNGCEAPWHYAHPAPADAGAALEREVHTLLFAYAECAEAWDHYLASIRTDAEAERFARLDRILVKHGYTEDCMSVRDWIVNLRARALCECNA